jgi:predicted nuclease with TOPRIM domain
MEEVKAPEVTPEEVKAPEVTPEQKSDPMIPKTRFDEVNAKYKELAEKVAQFEEAEAKAKADAEAKELQAKQEQGKFEELYQESQKELDSFKAYETRAKELETVITGMVETKLNDVPKEMHDLIPTNLSAEQTLDWLNKAEAKGLFGTGKSDVKEIGKPSNKSNEAPKVDKANLSPLDKILAGIGK